MSARYMHVPEIDSGNYLIGPAIGIENGRLLIVRGNVWVVSDGLGKIINQERFHLVLPELTDWGLQFETRHRSLDSIETYTYSGESLLGFGRREVVVRKQVDGVWRRDSASIRSYPAWPLLIPIGGMMIIGVYRIIGAHRNRTVISARPVGFEVISQDQKHPPK